MPRKVEMMNPVLASKTYDILGVSGQIIDEFCADSAQEALTEAKAIYGQQARAAILKNFGSKKSIP